MFAHRAYLIDLSRGKIPTTATLRRLVEILARFNYNELQIHLPLPFGEARAETVAPPFADDEFRLLESFASLHGVELVLNQDACGGAAAGGEVDDLRAYAAYAKRVDAAARARGRRPIFWGDVARRRPEALDALPKDALVLAGGYEGNHPYLAETVKVRTAGLDFYVCGGTSAWNALAGRVENMRENLQAAEGAGRRFGAKGYLVADWAGETHWQPLAASLPGLVLGGVFAYDGAKAPKMDLEGALDAVMGVPLGGVLLRLGTLYLRGGALHAGGTELFRILSHDRGYSRAMGFTDAVLAEISAVAEGCRHDAAQYASGTIWGEGAVWAQEIMYMANLVDAACNRRDEKRLRFLRDEHALVWRLRHREEGLAASQARLPRF